MDDWPITGPWPPLPESTLELFRCAEAFYLEDDLLGIKSHRDFNTNGGKPALHVNTAFFCPYSGEIWARRLFLGVRNSHWKAITRPAGSSILYRSDFTNYYKAPNLPLPVLKREVLLLINQELNKRAAA